MFFPFPFSSHMKSLTSTIPSKSHGPFRYHASNFFRMIRTRLAPRSSVHTPTKGLEVFVYSDLLTPETPQSCSSANTDNHGRNLSHDLLKTHADRLHHSVLANRRSSRRLDKPNGLLDL
jgi:hypothetical protein